MTKSKVILSAIACLFLLYAGATTTVVEKGQEALLTGEVKFDPNAEAKKFWDNNSQEYYSSNAVDLVSLVKEANGDLKNVAKKYGHYSMGDSGELSFIVKGTATVSQVKNKLRAGYIKLAVDGLEDTSVDYRIQVGPVFKGSAVRDSVSLINYKDYKNQIEWAQVGVALNNLVLETVLKPIDIGSLTDKKIEFIGCFTASRPSQVLITPVAIKVID